MSPQNQSEPAGSDIFGAPWAEDPRLQEQQTLGEPETESDPEPEVEAGSRGVPFSRTPTSVPAAGEVPSGSEQDGLRSAIKVTHTTRGTTWEVRVMAGDSEELLNSARQIAIAQYRAIERELG